jgi:predicted NBD/HSP70 family sugar kinase
LATPKVVRLINEANSLRVLFESGPMTRAELARRLGVTKSTIANVTAGLIAADLICDFETDEATKSIGRPGTRIGIDPKGAYFAGAEIGVDRISVALLDLTAAIAGKTSIPENCRALGVDQILDRIEHLIIAICGTNSLPYQRIRGLGVSVPAFLTRDGVVARAPNLGWRDLALLKRVQQRFPWPSTIENDANASALAEWHLSPRPRDHNLLMILLESGIGGGLVSEGRIVRGAHGFANEIGHILSSNGSTPVPWEDIVGKRGLLQSYSERCGRNATIDGLRDAIIRQEHAAVATAQHWARSLAHGIASLVYIHDPEEIVVGGELAAIFTEMADVVQHELCRNLLSGYPVPKISISRFSPYSCAIGAATIMHSNLFDSDLA